MHLRTSSSPESDHEFFSFILKERSAPAGSEEWSTVVIAKPATQKSPATLKSLATLETPARLKSLVTLETPNSPAVLETSTELPEN